MKFFLSKNIMLQILFAASVAVTSCNYLDVIPPARPEMADTMKDKNAVEAFLYSCYAGTQMCTPFHQRAMENSANEIVIPKTWDSFFFRALSWGNVTPMMNGNDIWNNSYNHIGYINRFLSLLEQYEPTGVTLEDKEQYKAECNFLLAYYHYRVLIAHGPCPIMDELPDQNLSSDQIPGRSHFDYCVDFIVKKLDSAAKVLPPVRPNEAEYGRATSVIAKCLKARILLYAASPLWNGDFPFKNWRNKNFETPGYGKELVSYEYDRNKWERAKTACEEALQFAVENKYQLFDLESANAKAEMDGVVLPFIPGKEEDTEENNLFKQRVRMFQYLVIAHEGNGNKEIIWGLKTPDEKSNASGDNYDSRLPLRCCKKNGGGYHGGWSGMCPTLYAVQHFYTENGKLPEYDSEFYPKALWYQRFYEDAKSPALGEANMGKENAKNDIIKLNANREARFYAWIAFDGCQYAQKINDGKQLYLNFKDKSTHGYNSGSDRNRTETGYLSKKYIDPNVQMYKNGNKSCVLTRRPYIRMAELYLNLAECYANLGDTKEALEKLNEIRRRAGFQKDLTENDCNGDMTLMDWIKSERYVELFEEGHNYYDIRRWCDAPRLLKAGTRWGLNALHDNPSFELFNRPVLIDQAFKWYDRMYLLPVWAVAGNDELYSNPQMVQAPGYDN